MLVKSFLRCKRFVVECLCHELQMQATLDLECWFAVCVSGKGVEGKHLRNWWPEMLSEHLSIISITEHYWDYCYLLQDKLLQYTYQLSHLTICLILCRSPLLRHGLHIHLWKCPVVSSMDQIRLSSTSHRYSTWLRSGEFGDQSYYLVSKNAKNVIPLIRPPFIGLWSMPNVIQVEFEITSTSLYFLLLLDYMERTLIPHSKKHLLCSLTCPNLTYHTNWGYHNVTVRYSYLVCKLSNILSCPLYHNITWFPFDLTLVVIFFCLAWTFLYYECNLR